MKTIFHYPCRHLFMLLKKLFLCTILQFGDFRDKNNSFITFKKSDTSIKTL